MKAILVILTAVLLNGEAAQAAPTDLSRLAWLAGCWQSDGAEAGSGEQWMPLAGGTLLGVGRTVKNGKTVAHEFMQIREHKEGQLAFLAQPSGQSPTAFPLLSLSDVEAVFEELQHDFPQRVVYALDDSGKLNARIEGMVKGRLKVIPFPMSRVNCDSLLDKARAAVPAVQPPAR
ncbi:MAG: DUF6265 family protein [Stagnimonas sp.]|nr:DUF6265 family protein [Stagnimonas sp.]